MATLLMIVMAAQMGYTTARVAIQYVTERYHRMGKFAPVVAATIFNAWLLLVVLYSIIIEVLVESMGAS